MNVYIPLTSSTRFELSANGSSEKQGLHVSINSATQATSSKEFSCNATNIRRETVTASHLFQLRMSKFLQSCLANAHGAKRVKKVYSSTYANFCKSSFGDSRDQLPRRTDHISDIIHAYAPLQTLLAVEHTANTTVQNRTKATEE